MRDGASVIPYFRVSVRTIHRLEDRRAEAECKDLQVWAWVEAQGD